MEINDPTDMDMTVHTPTNQSILEHYVVKKFILNNRSEEESNTGRGSQYENMEDMYLKEVYGIDNTQKH